VLPPPDAFDLLDPAVIEDPYPFYASLRQHAPVYEVPDTRVHLISTWALVEDALERQADFSAMLTGLLYRGEDGHPTLFDMSSVSTALNVIANADDPEHAVHRRLIQPQLALGRVSALESDVRALADRLLQPLLDARGGEWTQAVAHPLPTIVVARAIGLPESDLENLMHWAIQGGALLAGTANAAEMMALTRDADAMGVYLTEHFARALADRASHPADADLLGALAQGVHEGAITERVAVGILVVLVGAGGESTTSLTGSAVRILAERPELQEQLRRRPERIPAFVEETLRLESPFRGHYRVVRRPAELGAAKLGAGDRLLLLWASANRDPDAIERPDELDLERPTPRHHLAFGRGVHFCVGAPLARLEARVVLEQLLARTRRFSLGDRPPRHISSIFVRRLAHLDLDIQAT
jgi:cytochrome P450